MLRKKQGQVGETITWVVATIVIIVILSVSIFVASLTGKSKKFEVQRSADLVVTKSLVSYLKTVGPDEVTVYEQLKEAENLDIFTGPLAENVFKKFYEKEDEYMEIWMSMGDTSYSEYFGLRPASTSSGGRTAGSYVVEDAIVEDIFLKETRRLILILRKLI